MTALAPRPVRHLYDDALATLIGWVAPDGDQEALRRSFLAALAADPNAVAKSGPPAHLTASCLVLSPDHLQVLLHLHGKAAMWMQFGGHLEVTDEGLKATARREACEESGLTDLVLSADPIELDRHLLGGAFGQCSEHLDVRFAAVADPGEPLQISDESTSLGWWPVAELPQPASPDLPRLIAAAQLALPRKGQRGSRPLGAGRAGADAFDLGPER